MIPLKISFFAYPAINDRLAMGAILFGYVVLVVVSAAALVALAWGVHSLFYRDQFDGPSLMGARQLNYMRGVRERAFGQLATSTDETGKYKDVQYELVEDCTYLHPTIPSICTCSENRPLHNVDQPCSGHQMLTMGISRVFQST